MASEDGDLSELSEIAYHFDAGGRELGGPWWHELSEVERLRIVRTAKRYAASKRVASAAPADRNAVLSEIEDMHERAWSRESERGNLDRAEWHRECAGQMRAMKGERP